MSEDLPRYVRLSVPTPLAGRPPWYKSTFPTYAEFLWVGLYLNLAGPTIVSARVDVCLLGLVLADFLCFARCYYVPAMLGMQTGRSLYVVGSSTFGTAVTWLLGS